MLAVNDDQILPVSEKLLRAGKLTPGDIVFHCSGALAAAQLAALRVAGVHLASVHPVRSFADPQLVLQQFDGTFCSIEGDAQALAVLQPALQEIGAQEKPSVLIFNKIDAHRLQEQMPVDVQDAGADEQPKETRLEFLKNSWMARAHSPVLFISATNKTNLEELKEVVLREIKAARPDLNFENQVFTQ